MKWWRLKWKGLMPIRRFKEAWKALSAYRSFAGAYSDHRNVSYLFELIIHEMPLKDAENYVREMRAFYTAGWMKIMGQ